MMVELLGNTQTFVGILTTLVVLCLFRNDGNFFVAFLKHLKEDIKATTDEAVFRVSTEKQAKTALNGLRMYIDAVKKIPNCTLDQDLLKLASKRDIYAAELKNYANAAAKTTENSLQKIEAAPEFGFTALYAFCFCITILTLDVFLPKVNFVINICIHTFAIVSFIFIAFSWLHLLRGNNGRVTTGSTAKEQDTKYFLRIWAGIKNKVNNIRCSKNKWVFGVRIIVLLLILPSFALFGLSCLISNYPLFVTISTLLYTFALALVAGPHFNKIKHTIGYNRLFIVKHFVYLALFSIVAALFMLFIIWLAKHCSLHNNIYSIYTSTSAKYILCMFTALATILVPICTSTIKYWLVLHKFNQVIERKQLELSRAIESDNTSYQAIITEIQKLSDQQS